MVTQTTELTAVNDMLSAIGDTPVNSLTGLVTPTVTIARNILAMENRKLQSKGWHFNTDYDYRLTPDTDGIIWVPANMLKVDLRVELYGLSYDPVIRNGKLWDKKNRTFVWPEAIEAQIRWLFPFDELPETAKQYIMIRAGRVFVDRMVGDDSVIIFTRNDEELAWASLREEEADQADYNIFDNIDVAPTLLR